MFEHVNLMFGPTRRRAGLRFGSDECQVRGVFVLTLMLTISMCGIFAGTKAKADSKTPFMIFTNSNIKSVLNKYFGIWPLINV